jgi:hypothetical protein
LSICLLNSSTAASKPKFIFGLLRAIDGFKPASIAVLRV